MFPNGRATIKVAVSLGVQGSRTAPTDGLGVGIGFHFGDDVWSSLHTYLDLLAFNPVTIKRYMLFPKFRQATYTRILNGKSCLLRDRINYRSFNLLLLISCSFTFIIFKSKKIIKLLKKISKLFIS